MTEQPSLSPLRKTEGFLMSARAIAVQAQLFQTLGWEQGLFMEVHNQLVAIEKKSMPQFK